MLDYLKEYNITDSQLNIINKVLEDNNIVHNTFYYAPEKVIEILNIFLEYGIKNLYEIIIVAPTLFCDTVKSIKIRLENYEDKEELARLINENVENLIIADLL